MKCEACGKETKNPVIVRDGNTKWKTMLVGPECAKDFNKVTNTQLVKQYMANHRRWYRVTSGSTYVLVRAGNTGDAERLAIPKLRQMTGREPTVVHTKPASDSDIGDHAFHVKNVRKEASVERSRKRTNAEIERRAHRTGGTAKFYGPGKVSS